MLVQPLRRAATRLHAKRPLNRAPLLHTPPPLAARRFTAALASADGQVTMGHFREGRKSLMGAVAGLFAGAASAVDPAAQRRGDAAAAAQKADVFLAINASTIELADLGETGVHVAFYPCAAAADGCGKHRWAPVPRLLEPAAAGAAAAHSIPSYPTLPCFPPAEIYVNETVGARPVVTWNMELDTLRSDLGEPWSILPWGGGCVGWQGGDLEHGSRPAAFRPGCVLAKSLGLGGRGVLHARPGRDALRCAFLSWWLAFLFAAASQPRLTPPFHPAHMRARSTGLLGFPPKDLQHRFLCRFKPVFYIRQRDYSKVGGGRGLLH